MEVVIILLGVMLDRVTKIWALKTLKDSSDIVVIPNFFSFSYLSNKGAAFGIMQNKQMLLSAITVVVILGMVFYLFKYKNSSKLTKISFSLILGGAIGNLIDRVQYKYVVDFILLHYKDVYYYPTFNVADMLVVVGTILFAFCILKEEK